MSNLKVHLVIIDPQNDFAIADDGAGNKGALVVSGADKDLQRVAAMVDRIGPKLDDISVTLDSHQSVGIERPDWFKRASDGAKPAPFTILGIHPDGRRIVKFDGATMKATEEEYTTRLPGLLHKGGPTNKGTFGYLEALANLARYPHVIWPIHCRVGSWGHGVVPVLDNALQRWEIGQFGKVNYITKGNNPFTEHFSAVRAEVPDPTDPTTQVNSRFIQTLEDADMVILTGEALSHCLASTTRDVIEAFSDPKYTEKLVLLKDCCSPVTGFEKVGDDFIKAAQAKGMRVSDSQSILA